MEEFLKYLVHWPFIAFMVIIWVVAQTMKTRILTAELAAKNKFIFWFRRIFPLILLALGVLTGSLWPGETSPGISAVTHKIMYFTAASAASIVVFNSLKTWIKKKYDVEIEFPRLSIEDTGTKNVDSKLD